MPDDQNKPKKKLVKVKDFGVVAFPGHFDDSQIIAAIRAHKSQPAGQTHTRETNPHFAPVQTEQSERVRQTGGAVPELPPPSWDKLRQYIQEKTEPVIPASTTGNLSVGQSLGDINRLTGSYTENTLKQTGRMLFGMADFPVQMTQVIPKLFSSDPKISSEAEGQLLSMHPGAQAADLIKQTQQDWNKSKALAGTNLAGDALGFWLGGKLAHGIEAVPLKEAPPRFNSRPVMSNEMGEVRIGMDNRPSVWLSPKGWNTWVTAFDPHTDPQAVSGMSVRSNRALQEIFARKNKATPEWLQVQQLVGRAHDTGSNAITMLGREHAPLGSTAPPTQLDAAFHVLPEEAAHTWQRNLAQQGWIETHLSKEAFQRTAAKVPGPAKARLTMDGYDVTRPTEMVVETAAKFIVGDLMGTSPADASVFLDHYLKEVTDQHGPNALAELEKTRQATQQLQEQIHAEHTQRAGSPASVPSVAAGRTGGAGALATQQAATAPAAPAGDTAYQRTTVAPQGDQLQREANFRNPSNWIAAGARDFLAREGRTMNPHAYSPLDFRNKDIADAYNNMQHNPNDPKVKAAYDSMKADIDKQWDYATQNMGMKFEPWTKEGQPYANSKDMATDVRNNHHMYFFKGGEMPSDHPLAQTDTKTGLSYNDMLRCFVSGTLVRTRSGFTPIENIRVGEEVLSAFGNWKRVTKTGVRAYSGDLIEITTNGSFSPIRVTPEHPFLALRAHHRTDKQSVCTPYICSRQYKDRQRDVDADLNHSFGWVKAGELVNGTWFPLVTDKTVVDFDYVEVPVECNDKRFKEKAVQRFDLTPEFLWVIGFYIAEGCAGDNKITFALHRSEKAFLRRLKTFAQQYGFGASQKKASENGIALEVYSAMLMRWFPEWLGKGASNKQIPPELLRLPSWKLQHIIRGILDGDGRKLRNNIEQTSLALALQLVEAGQRLGQQPTTGFLPRSREEHHDAYRVHEVLGAEHSFRQKKYTWRILNADCRQMQTTRCKFDGFVYNLSVEGDESYIVENVPTHNCVHDLFGHAMEGFQFGPRGEENAWIAHTPMFSPEALPALTTETKGQNSWVNAGPHLRDPQGNIIQPGQPGYIPPRQRPFAQQKAGLLPERFHYRLDRPISFVSSNTFPLDLKGASVRLASRTQKAFSNLSNQLASALHANPIVRDAIGYWEGGAENSTISHFQHGTDRDTLVYHAANMAKLGNQYSWAVFMPEAGGGDRMYGFHVDKSSPEKIASVLRDNGISDSTIEKTEDGHTVFVAAKGTELESKIRSIADQLGVKGDVGEYEGRTEFGGASISREDANAEHLRTIEGLEQRHPEWKGIRQAFEQRPDYTSVSKFTREAREPFVVGEHGSRVPELIEIDPDKQGTGPQRGAEAARRAADPDLYPPRSYFQLEGTPGEKLYRQLPNQYRTHLNAENVYDLEKDPDGLWDLVPPEYQGPRKLTFFEKLVKDSGYDGVFDPRRGVIETFKGTPVEKLAREGTLFKRQPKRTWKDIEPHLTEEEKARWDTKEKRQKLVDITNLAPSAEEQDAWVKAGISGKLWYERSTRAFDALVDSQPDMFKKRDKEKFLNFVAALSPVQPVRQNLLMAINLWDKWNKAGRPVDVVWKDAKNFSGVANKNSSLYRILKGGRNTFGVDLPARLLNGIRALQDQAMSGPKVSAFSKNLGEDVNRVTNDTWMAILFGHDPNRINQPHIYDAMSAMAREAGEKNGIPGRQAQAAAWSFIKSLAELSGWGKDRWIPPQEIIKQGLLTPDLVNKHAADFADLLKNDDEIRSRIKDIGGDLDVLDRKLEKYVPERPKQGSTAHVDPRLLDAAKRLEAARTDARIEAHLARKVDKLGLFDESFDPVTFKRQSAIQTQGSSDMPTTPIKPNSQILDELKREAIRRAPVAVLGTAALQSLQKGEQRDSPIVK